MDAHHTVARRHDAQSKHPSQELQQRAEAEDRPSITWMPFGDVGILAVMFEARGSEMQGVLCWLAVCEGVTRAAGRCVRDRL